MDLRESISKKEIPIFYRKSYEFFFFFIGRGVMSVPKKKVLTVTVTVRGGQKTVEPNPPDQSGRPARPPTRLLAYIRTDTDTDILNIRITDE